MFFFFKQKTAYEMRISDWSSDVCSSDLLAILDSQYRLPLSVEVALPLGDSGGPPRDGMTWPCLSQRRLHNNKRVDPDRKSVVSGKSVAVRVDLGGRRIIKQKNHTQ